MNFSAITKFNHNKPSNTLYNVSEITVTTNLGTPKSVKNPENPSVIYPYKESIFPLISSVINLPLAYPIS